MPITLKAARVNAELTQDDAAQRLGITRVTLAKYEKYKTSPSINMAKKIAQLYNLPEEDIIFSLSNRA